MRALRPIVGLAVSFATLALLARAVDVDALLATLRGFDWRWIPLAIAFHFLGVWLRSIRWGLLLPGQQSQRALFRISVIGFAVNNLVPVRIGDVVRTYLVARWCGTPLGTTVASLVVERILDGFTLALLLLLALVVVPAPTYLVGFGAIAAAGFSVCALVMLLAALRPTVLIVLTDAFARMLPARFGDRIGRLARNFGHGLTPLARWRAWPALLGMSLLAWLGQFGLFYVLMFGLPMAATPGLALLGGSAANFATLVPSSPGFVGTFDAALSRVIVDSSSAGLDVATAYALVVHTVLFLPIIVLAALLIWRSELTPAQLLRLNRFSAGHKQATGTQPPTFQALQSRNAL